MEDFVGSCEFLKGQIKILHDANNNRMDGANPTGVDAIQNETNRSINVFSSIEEKFRCLDARNAEMKRKMERRTSLTVTQPDVDLTLDDDEIKVDTSTKKLCQSAPNINMGDSVNLCKPMLPTSWSQPIMSMNNFDMSSNMIFSRSDFIKEKVEFEFCEIQYHTLPIL